MFRSSRRNFAIALAIPVLSLALAACGSTAINSNYTPGPTANAVGAPSSTPSAHVSKSARPTTAAHAKPTHAATAKVAAPKTSHPGAPKKTASTPPRTGGKHPAPSPCVWQAGSPSIIVTPCTGLVSGQTVTIRGRGFKPNLRVLAVECVSNASGPNACNLPKNVSILNPPPTFQPNPDGTITLTLKVLKTFNGYTCSAASPCVVSISSTDGIPPSEDPSAPIFFR